MAIQSPIRSQIQPVAPGDLITAAFINRLVAAVQNLEDRVADLEEAPEPGTGPASPPRGPRTPRTGIGEVVGVAIEEPIVRNQDEISGRSTTGGFTGMRAREDP